MKTNIIKAENLKKSYGALEVLKGVDFTVERGEIFALLGSNGAGKTTVVKILSTLLRGDGGSAAICGFDVKRQSRQVKGCISLTGQFAAVDEVLTGRENLILIAKLRHLKNPGKTADNLLSHFELTEAGSRRVRTYSGGMRRRLDISKEIKQLSENGKTVFLTTQYLEEAEQLADHIAILHEGKIIANGTLAELKKHLPSAKVEYVTYSLPGILLIAIASASAYTAIRIFEDIRSGFFDRLNSMPISASSALWAHVLTSLISNALSLAIILVVAFFMGFRSPAGILNCLGAAGILTFFTLALTWIAAFAGLKARTADGAGAFAYPLVFLPFISSAFLSTETMPAPVRAFAQNQPVTAIVDSVRALLMNQPVGSEIWTALASCTGILLIAYFMSMRAYKRRRS